MSDTDQKLTFDELTRPGEPASDPDYLAWKKRSVRKALENARANPDELISHEEMRRRLGLEH